MIVPPSSPGEGSVSVNAREVGAVEDGAKSTTGMLIPVVISAPCMEVKTRRCVAVAGMASPVML